MFLKSSKKSFAVDPHMLSFYYVRKCLVLSSETDVGRGLLEG